MVSPNPSPTSSHSHPIERLERGHLKDLIEPFIPSQARSLRLMVRVSAWSTLKIVLASLLEYLSIIFISRTSSTSTTLVWALSSSQWLLETEDWILNLLGAKLSMVNTRYHSSQANLITTTAWRPVVLSTSLRRLSRLWTVEPSREYHQINYRLSSPNQVRVEMVLLTLASNSAWSTR